MNGITGFSESSWDIGPILMGVSSDWLSWLFITKLATYIGGYKYSFKGVMMIQRT